MRAETRELRARETLTLFLRYATTDFEKEKNRLFCSLVDR